MIRPNYSAIHSNTTTVYKPAASTFKLILARRTHGIFKLFSSFFSDFIAFHEDPTKALLLEQEEQIAADPEGDRAGRLAAAISSLKHGDSFEFVAASYGKDAAAEALAACKNNSNSNPSSLT